ncbi:MAG TPA: pilus assembly protein PilM [Burkholderiaceae bacterium]|nr:pilus assembly protein PilM [Burkholderiaceae bacterium]
MAFDLRSLLSSKSPPLVGLDISTTSVKLVEIAEAGRSNYRLVRYAIEPLPKGAVVDGNIDNIEAVSEAVRRVWRKSGTRLRNVAMALPSAAVITKRIFLPEGMSEEVLEVQVETEANQYIPFALDEVSLDFQVLGPAQHSLGDVEVLIAASRKEKVEDRVAAAQAAGLKPVVVDIEAYATRAAVERLRKMLPNNGDNMIVAVFNIGANTTSISVLLNGQTIYEREQAFGGNQLTQDIARAFGLSLEDAEAKKRSLDLPENYNRDVLQPFIESTALEVTRALQFFFTSTPYGRVDQILLAGGTAVIEGLADVVASRAQTPTQVVNPFKGMEIDDSIRDKQLRLDAPSLVTCTGLAMRRFTQ